MARRFLPFPNARAQFRQGFERHMRNIRKFGAGSKRDLDDGGVPVEPNKPRDLSGGAAAALEFDD